MRVLQIALILIAGMSSASLAQSVRTENYAVIPFWESPIIPFRGASPISEEVSKGLLHFELDYDSLNRVIQASVKIGDHLKAFEGFSKYQIHAPLTKVDFDTNREIHSFYDHLEQPITVMGEVFKKVYDKDDYGRNVRLRYFDKAGNETPNYFGYVRYEWSYERDGSVVEERFDVEGQSGPLRGSFQFMRTRIAFGADGYPNLLQNIDSEGALVNAPSGAATFKYFYDQQGRFDRWEVFDKEGNRAIGPSNTSGEQNVHKGYYLESINFFDSLFAPVAHWSGAEKWHQQYDRYGNRTRRSFQRADGTLMNGHRGYAETVTQWSEDGRWLLAEWLLDAEGIPVNHPSTGLAKTEYIRDVDGALVETRKYEYREGDYRQQ